MRGGLDDKNKCTLINGLTGVVDKKVEEINKTIESINNEIDRINTFLTTEVATKDDLINYVTKSEFSDILNPILNATYTIINLGYKNYAPGEAKYKTISNRDNLVVSGTQYGTRVLTWQDYDESKVIAMIPLIFNPNGVTNYNNYEIGKFIPGMRTGRDGSGPYLQALMFNDSSNDYNFTGEANGTPAILVLTRA